MLRLDEKLARIRRGEDRPGDFIIADAKDSDMGPSMAAAGRVRLAGGGSRPVTRAEFLDACAGIVRQDLVDIMLLSLSNYERLAERGVFDGARVTPAIRANDTTDVWRFRGATYAGAPSRPFRTADPAVAARLGCHLGLYSITFNNDLDADLAGLEAYAAFRADAARVRFRHFLEVFNPNAPRDLALEDVGAFVNDAIVRAIAGLSRAERPEFLKIAYNGPDALEELAGFDPELVVGILGGGAGTSRDCLELIAQVEAHGARVALFGRKIAGADDPEEMVRMMRAVADRELSSEAAVREYHGALERKGIAPTRPLEDDLAITEEVLRRAA
ncbi:hypothetical protein [uncultured Jannaschia sp.]|uniref:hypothetical protein n=1 Tax=uncultured Jannaschia sp. TaxID=293347 RepID=UPI002627268D|nr:hypothetical protein [uncultured Jannaschia sp.]